FRVRQPLIKRNQPTGWFFAFGEPDSPSNCVRFTRRIPATRPAGSAVRCAKTLQAFLSGPGTTYLKKPAYGLVFCFWRAGLSIELRSIHSSHPCDSPCGQRGALCKNAWSVFAQRTALPAGRVAGMRRVNRTQFDGESGSPKAKNQPVGWFL
ncbi:hypothetical protein QLZ26_06585, partial [Cronobacter universalis]|nr:hypothetical protein [Cronobacter universalis]